MRFVAKLGYQGGEIKSFPKESLEEFRKRCEKIAIFCNPKEIEITKTEE